MSSRPSCCGRTIERALDIFNFEFRVERVVDHVDHPVERVGLLDADVVDVAEPLVGGDFVGAGDVRDVGGIGCLAAVAEQLEGFTAGDSVHELCGRVGVLASVFLRH